MWNTVSGNKLLDRRRKEQAHRRHQEALRAIRPLTDTSSPNEYSFLYSRPKARQQLQERQDEIESLNTLLVEKMMKSSSYVRPRYDAQLKDSLNSVYRTKVERQIDVGNQKLVQRLQTAKSHYSRGSLSQSMKNYDKYRSNLVKSRMDPFYDMEKSREDKPSRNSRGSRPFSAKQ